MEDFIEKTGGDLRIRPKSHIRGEEKSPRHEVRKWEKGEASKFEEKKTEEFGRQDVGQGIEEMRPGADKEILEKPDTAQTEESYDWEGDMKEDNDEETPEEPTEQLRPDLEVRNQPEPGRYKGKTGGPKHFR